MWRNTVVVPVVLLLTLGLQPVWCSPSSGAQPARGANLVDASPTLVVTSAADSSPGALRWTLWPF
jgi:hypothetical protein